MKTLARITVLCIGILILGAAVYAGMTTERPHPSQHAKAVLGHRYPVSRTATIKHTPANMPPKIKRTIHNTPLGKMETTSVSGKNHGMIYHITNTQPYKPHQTNPHVTVRHIPHAQVITVNDGSKAGQQHYHLQRPTEPKQLTPQQTQQLQRELSQEQQQMQ